MGKRKYFMEKQKKIGTKLERKLENNTFRTTLIKNSRSQMFFKMGVLKSFVNFKGKHLCWSLFLIKLLA